MPVWEREEIEKLRKECYPATMPQDVDQLYAYWGGIVRWVLQHPNEPKWLELDHAATAMDSGKLQKACRSESDDKV